MPVALPSLSGVTHRTLDVHGLAVHVAEAGQGPPLVLLHGWPQHWWCWRHVVPLLAPSYHLVMPDLRGHGWTAAPAGGYDKEQLASDLLGTLDSLGLDRVGLVGHDWGGWTGCLACLRAPERFSGFLALGITHPFQRVDRRVFQAWRASYQMALSTPMAAAALRVSPRLVESSVLLGATRRSAFTPADLRLYGAVLQEPARARASTLLYRTFLLREGIPVMRGRYDASRLTVATRLVGGSGDPVIVPSLLDGWQDHADDMIVEVLDGVGHFVPEEAPQEVAARVRALVPAA